MLRRLSERSKSQCCESAQRIGPRSWQSAWPAVGVSKEARRRVTRGTVLHLADRRRIGPATVGANARRSPWGQPRLVSPRRWLPKRRQRPRLQCRRKFPFQDGCQRFLNEEDGLVANLQEVMGHQEEDHLQESQRSPSRLVRTTQSAWCARGGRPDGVRPEAAGVRFALCAQRSTQACAGRQSAMCAGQQKTCTVAGARSTCARITVTSGAVKPGRSVSGCNKAAIAVRSAKRSRQRGAPVARSASVRRMLDTSASLRRQMGDQRHGRHHQRHAGKRQLRIEDLLPNVHRERRRRRQARMKTLRAGPTSHERRLLKSME